MMPYDSYQLYQVERAKSPAEIRHADEQAGRLASAASSLFRGITRPWRASAEAGPAAPRDLPAQPDQSACTGAERGLGCPLIRSESASEATGIPANLCRAVANLQVETVIPGRERASRARAVRSPAGSGRASRDRSGA